MDQTVENDPLPWLLVDIEPEKEAEIRLFRRRRSERIHADPESEQRWRAGCDEYEPVRALREKRDQIEHERKSLLDEFNEQRRRLLVVRAGFRGDIFHPRDRIMEYLNTLHTLTEQLRDLECLCEAKAEMIRAHRQAADPAVPNPADAKSWLELCERYQSIVDQCWQAECERRVRDA